MRVVEVPVEAEDVLCLSLMPSLWALPGDRWATLHDLVHPHAAAIVEELDDAQLVASLLEAVCPCRPGAPDHEHAAGGYAR